MSQPASSRISERKVRQLRAMEQRNSINGYNIASNAFGYYLYETGDSTRTNARPGTYYQTATAAKIAAK